MFSAAVDLAFDGDDWKAPGTTLFYRTASVGNSWGVTSIGRGFNWTQREEEVDSPVRANESLCRFTQPEVADSDGPRLAGRNHGFAPHLITPYAIVTPTTPIMVATSAFTAEPFSITPPRSPSPSPSLHAPRTTSGSSSFSRHVTPRSSSSPSSPRPRRRSSQQRVSLVAGRVLIAPIEPPASPPLLSPILHRSGNTNGLLTPSVSSRPPSPFLEKDSFLGGRSMSEFVIEGEIGRGAYGLVKKCREIQTDGSLGVRDIYT
jgi:protein-serine/threonine kinase